MMGSRSAKVKQRAPDILDLVLPWTLEDVFDQNLYADKVQKIPVTFDSVRQYMESFVSPLMEELRAKMCSSFEELSNAPFSKIISLEKKIAKEQLYNVRTQCWHNDSGSGNSDGYHPSYGDVFVLANIIPETISDFNCHGKIHCLASISRIPEEVESSTSFEVRVSKYLELGDGRLTSFFVFFLFNITMYTRVWKALHDGVADTTNLNIIKEVLRPKIPVEPEKCYLCSTDELVRLTPYLPELNKSQCGAILSCISQVQCEHHHSVKLIWGPPGTGKTQIVGELLLIFLSMKRAVLTCCPTNIAVQGIASRVLKLVKRNRNSGNVGESLCYTLGDILLYGNKKKLNLSDDCDLNDIFLDNRVGCLLKCFVPMTGWAHRISVLIDFLENCVSEYQMHLKNEKEEMQCIVRVTFLHFLRTRFHAHASSIGECIRILCTHLPSSCLSDCKLNNLIDLQESLDNFGGLLSQTFLDDGELEKAFCLNNMSANEPPKEQTINHALALLTEGQGDCLRLLKSLQAHSLFPQMHKRNSIRDYCLRSASLVLCTPSTSFKLRSRSFDLLVIDEAARLKECESVIPLQLSGIQHVVLIGDEFQLPATVKSKVCQRADFGRSLFERLSLLGHEKHLLEVQYRMHPSISQFPNKRFYGGALIDAPSVSCKDQEVKFLPERIYGPYSFINVSDGKEEKGEHGGSRRNFVEVSVVLRILKKLYQAKSKDQILSVGVISPYAAQVDSIQKNLAKWFTLQHENFKVKVRSIDGFQGGEEDVIIISTVRSNNHGSIGFLSSPQRANVALTRARHSLWIVGNATTLVKSGSIWEALVRDAKERCCFFDASDDEHISHAIVRVKKELDQMEDLLKKDSAIFRNARWKVLFSDNFKRSFTKIKSDQTKKKLITLLMKLAGGWRPIYDTSVNCYSSSKIARQYKMESLYVICTVDIEKSTEYTQVLRIWDVLPLYEIPALVKRLDTIFSKYTSDYVSRCETTYVEGNLELPLSWGREFKITQYKDLAQIASADGLNDKCANFAENAKVSESLLLMKFYSMSSGVARHLLTGKDGKEIELPFESNEEENDMIVFPRSSFILGRSGTGKTTVLTMKLIRREQLQILSSEGFHELNGYSSFTRYNDNMVNSNSIIEDEGRVCQLFVTVSSKLCLTIKNHISRLRSFICGEDYSNYNSCEMNETVDEIIDLDIPDDFVRIDRNNYPLVITFQKFLIMLDGSIRDSFFSKFIEPRGIHSDERGLWRSPAFHVFMRQKEVTYGRFASTYWPHFDIKCTKKLDSSMVFKEIISHIKGGNFVTKAFDRVLKKDEYVKLSESRQSTVDIDVRELIYDIYLEYEQRKLKNGDYDTSDLVINLHRRLKEMGGSLGAKIDYVYVDEVQDLTLSQIALFKHVCRNYEDGFVFAGDTAQTIAHGIHFRFQDIRSLFYTYFLAESQTNNVGSSKDNILSKPHLFHLNRNFRTHAGILKLSQSIVDILYAFFPLSIDRLDPETSLISGEAPVLLESNDQNAIVTILGSSEITGDCHTYGFGAEQVILVRDYASKEEITGIVGKQALVLTILECKGLEFQDVLLYNFFGTSPLKNKWRVIYSYMKLSNLIEPTAFSPCFDPSKHSILCSELKQLYVAVTRTRQRLWIYETAREFSEPMFDYWKKLGVVQERQLDESLARGMRVASSCEEWSDRGLKLFHDGNYDLAAMCFERAGNGDREKWARAAGLRANGSHILQSNHELGSDFIRKAAELYESIRKFDTAAQCYIELKDYKRAGMFYLEKFDESRLEDAGDCFFLGRCWSEAAEVYWKCKLISKCLSSCSEGKLFNKGLNFIKCWELEDQSPGSSKCGSSIVEVKNAFFESSAIYYHKVDDKANMMRFVDYFTSIEHKRKFLKSRDYLEELVQREDEHGNFKEAAEAAMLIGDLLLEANMLEKAGLYEDAVRCILFYVVTNSLWTGGRSGWPLVNFNMKEVLLAKAKSLSEKCSAGLYESVGLEANILLANGRNGLTSLVKYLDRGRSLGNFRAVVFSSRMILDVFLQTQPSKLLWEDIPKTAVSNTSFLQYKVTYKLLIYVWNCWKQKILLVLEYLNSVGDDLEVLTKDCKGFCLEFFGVQQQNNRNCVISNSGASWIKQTGCKFACGRKDLFIVTVRHFKPAARKYWSSELFSVGKKLLEFLRELHRYLEMEPPSYFRQSLVLLSIYDVAKFLIELRLENWKMIDVARNFLSYSYQSYEFFIKILFPFDWRKVMDDDIFSLRGNDSARKLLREIIIGNMKGSRKVSCGEIGRMTMLVFGMRNMYSDHNIQNYIKAHYPSWKMLFEKLAKNAELWTEQVNIVLALNHALESTFAVNWQAEVDYIAPHCFLYLAERLLFFSSACNGYFHTTKSSITEATMNDHSWNAVSGCLSVGIDSACQDIQRKAFEFVAYIVKQLLINNEETSLWLKKSGLSQLVCHQQLVLRLIIMISMVHLNSGLYFDSLCDLLRQEPVVTNLPCEFTMWPKGMDEREFVLKFASALYDVGDALVIVDCRSDCLMAFNPKIITVNREMATNKTELLRVLYRQRSR